MSFVFYDTETTGTKTAFDQILQFGAIRTDHELRELDRFEIRCRLLPYPCAGPGTGGDQAPDDDPGRRTDLRDGGECLCAAARACGCRQRPRRHRETLIKSGRGWSGREAH